MVVASTRKPLFPLGNIYATPGAIETLNENGQDVAQLLQRHIAGDWGNLDSEDKQANDDALERGARIFSAYGEGNKKLWIITEADRSATTVLRPDE